MLLQQKKKNIDLSIINAVNKSNQDRIIKITNKISSKIKNNSTITLLGLSFKPNTVDMREASSLFMIPYLNNKGAKIRYFDPSGYKKEFEKFKKVKFCKDISAACLKSDLIIIHTEWNEFKLLNFKKIVKKSKFTVYDMRNIYNPSKMKANGIKYFGVGR